jgi:predicted nucleic acid-binding protein
VILCDTTVASSLFVGDTRCAQIVQLPSAIKAISIVTAAEMRFGALNDNWGPRKQQLLEAHLNTYLQIPVDDTTAREWARLRDIAQRAGFAHRDNDLWIAATGSRHGIAVAALDPDFSRMPGLWVILSDGTERRNP